MSSVENIEPEPEYRPNDPYGLLMERIDYHIEHPPGNDQLIPVVLRGFKQVHDESPDLRDDIEHMAMHRKVTINPADRPGLKVREAAEIVRAGVQWAVNKTDRNFLKPGYDISEEQVAQGLRRMLNDPELEGTFRVLINQRRIATNPPERAAAIDPYLQAIHEITGEKLSVLFVGCSIGLIERQLLLKHNPRFKLGQIATKGGGIESPVIRKINEEILPRNINPIVDKFVGIDIFPPDDPETYLWGYFCRRPQELVEGTVVRRMRELKAAYIPEKPHDPDKPDHINYTLYLMRANLLDDDDNREFGAKYPPGTFNVVFYSHMLYQLMPGEIKRQLELARHYGTPDVQIGILDHARIKDGDLSFIENWDTKHWENRLIHIDAAAPDSAPHIFQKHKDGRCQQVVHHGGPLTIAGVATTPREAILNIRA